MGKVLKVAGMSDVGRERDHNEDCFGLFPEYNLFVVADGMGGHRAGDVASRLAVDSIGEFFVATSRDDITWPFQFDPNSPTSVNRFVTAIQVGNSKIFRKSSESEAHQGMGTTVVGVMGIEENSAMHVAHVGDSRCYRIRGGEITAVTLDHSLINDYLRAAPDLTEEQLAELPTNVITRALGMQDKVLVDVQTITIEAGDVMLLCSDGLNGMLKDADILRIVETHRADLQKAAQALIDGANERGGEDNITVVLVEVVQEN
ncbi:MAG: Stp1/IreP family PP2C-type Ser/Thr phosphatase [Deltaproteobacteria bacterium]|nr:Stp1/IreP family PP2C-type Ser/Thr phosphatase [Deltaproteobacteria bacterium]